MFSIDIIRDLAANVDIKDVQQAFLDAFGLDKGDAFYISRYPHEYHNLVNFFLEKKLAGIRVGGVLSIQNISIYLKVSEDKVVEHANKLSDRAFTLKSRPLDKNGNALIEEIMNPFVLIKLEEQMGLNPFGK